MLELAGTSTYCPCHCNLEHTTHAQPARPDAKYTVFREKRQETKYERQNQNCTQLQQQQLVHVGWSKVYHNLPWYEGEVEQNAVHRHVIFAALRSMQELLELC